MFNLGYKNHKKSGQYVDVSSLPVTGQSHIFERVLENEKGRFSVTFLVYGFGANQKVRILKVVPMVPATGRSVTDTSNTYSKPASTVASPASSFIPLPILQEKQVANYKAPKTGYKEPAISHFSYIYLSSQMTRAPSGANFARFA